MYSWIVTNYTNTPRFTLFKGLPLYICTLVLTILNVVDVNGNSYCSIIAFSVVYILYFVSVFSNVSFLVNFVSLGFSNLIKLPFFRATYYVCILLCQRYINKLIINRFYMNCAIS